MQPVLIPRCAALVLGLTVGALLGSAPGAALAQPAAAQPSQSGAASAERLSVAEARAAANRILAAVQTRDPELRYSQFSDPLKAITTPALVAERISSEPRLLSWQLLSVRGGLSTTTVEASLETSDGTRDLFMVLDPKGRLDAYHFDLTDARPSQVAGEFVRALSAGQFATAQSFLSLPMQADFSAAVLRDRWRQLQRQTGDFVAVRRVVEADSSDGAQLVLVNTEFAEVTDSLFVILNTNNEIVGVNFPIDPVRPRRFARDSQAGPQP
ncbi:MAG: DUF3887 domain-containing protein [Cyanobacteria bacterium J06638_7]